MSTIRDYAEAYLLVKDILTRQGAEDPSALDLIPEIEAEFVVVYRELLKREVTQQKVVNLTPVRSNGAAEVGETGDMYESFSTLFKTHGIPVPDGMRVWFKDHGGWNAASPEVQLAVYNKAKAYYEERLIGDANAAHDETRCYACGSPGEKSSGQYGDYYKCSDPTCGFPGRDGFVRSTWDADPKSDRGWQAKRDKLRGGGRGQGRGFQPRRNYR